MFYKMNARGLETRDLTFLQGIFKRAPWGFGGTVDKNLPLQYTGDLFIPSPGRSYMPRNTTTTKA